MPALTITVTHQDNMLLEPKIEAEFDTGGGTIGRASECTLVLPDPERQISRMHARIAMQGSDFVLHDEGSAIPVVINGEPLGKGKSSAIHAGDEIEIGPYSMRVDALAPEVDLNATIIGGRSPLAPRKELPPTPAPADLSMIGTVLSWEQAAASDSAIRTVDVPSPAALPETQAPPAQRASSDPPPAGADVPVAPLAPQELPAAVPPSMPIADSAPASTNTIAGSDPLLEALLKGAGVPHLAIPGGLSPELMRTIGGMLRESLRGLLDLLQARAMTKRKLRADATVIVAQDNNPLKFSPTVEAVMTHMLVPLGSGFMPPVRALADANQSLHSHQLGFKAGMQAGLGSVLKRLDPHALEERTARPSLIGALVPSAHKSRLWDAYAELHASVTRDADSDFHSLFEREFLSAYHSEVSRSRSSDTG